MTEKTRIRTEQAIEKQARKFHAKLRKQGYPRPSLIKLMLYRMSRTSIKKMLDENYRDYSYFKEKGWFESDYYYPVNLSLFKRTMGRLFDFAARNMAA